MSCNFDIYFGIKTIMLGNWQKKQKQDPHFRVIAHRGLSSLFPQNTKQAIIAGMHCSDFVQFDILLTLDDEVIVFHDRGLKTITDVKNYPQFSNRLKQQCLNDSKEVEKDWWIRDFTYAELQILNVKQRFQYRMQMSQSFKISKLQDIIQECLKLKKQNHQQRKLKSGLLIQIKQQTVSKFTKRDIILCEKLSQILKKYNLSTPQGCIENNLPVIVQSFNIQILKLIQTQCENHICQLYKKDVQLSYDLLLKNKTNRVIGIGITTQSICDNLKNPSTKLKQICDRLGYQILYWTVRDDDYENIPFKLKSYDQVYKCLIKLGVTGFITEFPDKCKGVLNIQSIKYQADKEQLAEKCLRNVVSTIIQNSLNNTLKSDSKEVLQ